MKTPFLLGRIIFGGFFIYNGIHHLTNRKQISQYAAAKKVPMPDIAVTSSGVVLIVGGTSILLGVQPKLGAAAILGFLLGISPAIHDFWRAEDPNQRTADMINFTKNMALAGAALAPYGSGRTLASQCSGAASEKIRANQAPCATALGGVGRTLYEYEKGHTDSHRHAPFSKLLAEFYQ